jgi:hypothetical protein
MPSAPRWGSLCSESSEDAEASSEDPNPLERMGEEFIRLRQELKQLSVVDEDADWSEEDEARWSAQTDPLRDRMTEICRDAILLRARGAGELRAKALFLFDLIEGETDLPSQLAISLCEDLLSGGETSTLAEAEREPDLAG